MRILVYLSGFIPVSEYKPFGDGFSERKISMVLFMILTIASFSLFACSGSDGKDGVDGTNASIQTMEEPAGENCANGGIKIEILLDGSIQEEQTKYICNGRYFGGGETSAMASKIIFSKNHLTTDETGSNDTVTVKLAKRPTSLVFVPVWSSNENEATVSPDNLIFTPENWDQPQTLTVHGVSDRVADGDADYYIIAGEIISEDVELEGSHAYLIGKNLAVTAALAGVEYVDIPAGSFTLTHETAAYASGNEVQLSAFKLGKTPVTVAQFQKCVAQGICSPDNFSYYNNFDGYGCNYNRGENWLNHPMNCVNWWGAKEFCEWIGGRLPTEEEWEYAATHNGEKHLNSTYPWGDTPPIHCQTANYSVYSDNAILHCNGKSETFSINETSEIGIYSPAGDSPLGLVDMAGNVWELTTSLYRFGVHYLTLKGSCMGSSNLSVSERFFFHTTEDEDATTGFRCAE